MLLNSTKIDDSGNPPAQRASHSKGAPAGASRAGVATPGQTSIALGGASQRLVAPRGLTTAAFASSTRPNILQLGPRSSTDGTFKKKNARKGGQHRGSIPARFMETSTGRAARGPRMRAHRPSRGACFPLAAGIEHSFSLLFPSYGFPQTRLPRGAADTRRNLAVGKDSSGRISFSVLSECENENEQPRLH